VSKKLLERLEKQFGEAILETHSQFGDDTAVVDPEKWVEIATFVRDNPRCAMDHFIDLTAVDYLNRRSPRYEVVLHVRSMEKLHRLRLKARLDADGDENPKIGSLCGVWRGANWFERECYDMFGVEFVGHPDLRRILMYEEFEGHPLRKDYPAQRTQPLVPYREGVQNDKLPPFGEREGMPWGRQVHDHVHHERNLLGFEEEG
jgi:NADH-quinone oxidoreductase subunit C